MIGCSFSLPSYRRRRALYEPGEAYEPGGGGGVRRCKHLRCVVAWCSYTVRLHGKVTQCGRVVWLRCGAAGLVRRIVPGALSTGFIHSVENLHACDSVEQS